MAKKKVNIDTTQRVRDIADQLMKNNKKLKLPEAMKEAVKLKVNKPI